LTCIYRTYTDIQIYIYIYIDIYLYTYISTTSPPNIRINVVSLHLHQELSQRTLRDVPIKRSSLFKEDPLAAVPCGRLQFDPVRHVGNGRGSRGSRSRGSRSTEGATAEPMWLPTHEEYRGRQNTE
jgi:hypothetical protein